MNDVVPVYRFPTPRVRRVGLAQPWTWIAAGFDDLRRAPGVALAYGAATFVASWLVVATLWSARALPLLLPLLAGFALLAPLLATGLYAVSRTLARGLRPSWQGALAALRENFAQIALMGALLLLLHLFWVRVATLLFAVFFARSDLGWSEFVALLDSGTGLAFLATGTILGAGFALVAFGCSVVAIPMLLDSEADVITAVATSWTAFQHNRAPLLLWAALIAGAMLASFATFFVGLVLAMPVIGFASWHAYRDLVLLETRS